MEPDNNDAPFPFDIQYLTNIDDEFVPPLQCDLETNTNVAMAVIMILIVIIGLFGNAIVFFVILVLREYKKSVSNWYVLQLALADTLFLLTLPFNASSELVGRWEFLAWMCKAKEGILFVNYYASIFFLTIMSFDRYMAVTKSGVSPWADVLRRLDSAILISVVTWVVSICLCIPIFLYSQIDSCQICAYDFPLTDQERCVQAGKQDTASCEEYLRTEDNLQPHEVAYHGGSIQDILNEMMEDSHLLDQNITADLRGFPPVIAGNESGQTFNNLNANVTSGFCKDNGSLYHTWLYLNFSIMLVLPFVLICIFYGMILRTMMGTPSTQSTNQRKYRRRVTLMVLALVTLFAVSWVPWYAVGLARIRGFTLSSAHSCDALSNFTRILSYLNSALNPYFYSLLSTRFPRRLSAAFNRSRRYTSQLSLHVGHPRRLHGVTLPPEVHQSSVNGHT